MGGRAGGSGSGFGSRSGGAMLQRGATEKGYSKELAKAVLTHEKQIKDKTIEHGAIFDDKGNMIYQNVGTNGRVSINVSKVQNNILTHNHPAVDRKGKPRRDGGGSFSDDDVRNTIRYNGKEVRAVTPKFTYSLKRPAGGWGVSSHQAVKRYHAIEKALDQKYKGQWGRYTRIDGHLVMKQLAKEFGWSYTKKKN